MAINPYSEDALCEQPAIELFSEIGWETCGCYDEFASGTSTLGRESKGDVLLVERLAKALRALNPGVPDEAIALAIEELARDRSSMSAAAANRDIYTLLKNGVKVAFRGGEDGTEETVETLRVIDWKVPTHNDFLLTSQLWIAGDMYTRRADLIGFVNGIPLLFIELKASHKALKSAYDGNLQDYRTAIPQLFWYNGVIILSNGSHSLVGSATAAWEHFAEWKRIGSEGEAGIVSLDTVIRGVCERDRLLDLVENFTLFMESRGGLRKVVARNHQYLGVNNAIEKLHEVVASTGMESIDGHGRLGVFWHTQGSGKSISMIFFAQKILRTVPGNWTFVIITDRDDLDTQIYKNFADAGVITGAEAQATSGEHLQQLLREDHRYVFTLIQKFQTRDGSRYPVLTDRSDIIVIADEAHRSQYETLALNMRNALPRAAFIAFTGTPLMAGEEKTRDVFGEYVSIYDFKQSTDDGATVPLYYENRVPELQLVNTDLNERMGELLEAAELDDQQEEKLAREFSREYHLITRDDRLEKVADDLVEHFMGRGFQGKAMVVSIDKATAVRMYDKVRAHWGTYLERLKAELPTLSSRRADAQREMIAWMEATDMAVVVSQGQNEVEEMKKKGVDIVPHRKRMVEEDLEEKFKDQNNPFRIVFVCAMWITGFDVPSCSTIYLDKPMRNHTLMQTIARANRVFPEKVNGLIVDYVGVFRNLQKALAIYGSGPDGGADGGEMPVLPKEELIEALRTAVTDAITFCSARGIDVAAIPGAIGFKRLALLDAAYEAIATDDGSKSRFRLLHAQLVRLFKAILPDTRASEFARDVKTIDVLAEKLRANTPAADIDGIMSGIETLLDASVAAQPYVIQEGPHNRVIDLSQIDFDALQEKFNGGRKRAAVDELRSIIEERLTRMVETNKTRIDFLEKFQKMIDDYNAASVNVEEFFKRLKEFAGALNTEDKRTISENLSEEELAIFDLLTRPEGELSKKDRKQIQQAARELLDTLKREKLVLDWRKRGQSRAQVRVTIEELLDRDLPASFTPDKFTEKCQLVYQHVYDSYWGAGRSVFGRTA